MPTEVPPGSQLAQEIKLAEEAEKETAAKLKAELRVLIDMSDQTSAPKKPAPTPEMEAPPEVKKATPKQPLKKATAPKKVDATQTPTKGKPSASNAIGEQTPKKEARVGLNKRLSDWASPSQALDLLAPASDNFIRQLLKLRENSWRQVKEKLVEVREARVAAAREAGKSTMPYWQPADVERTAEALACPTTSTKAKTPKRKASISTSPSTVREPSTVRDCGSPKKRKTIEPATMMQQQSPPAAPFAEMRFEPTVSPKDEAPELPDVPDDTESWEGLLTFDSPKTPTHNQAVEPAALQENLTDTGDQMDGLETSNSRDDDAHVDRGTLGVDHGLDAQARFVPIGDEENHYPPPALEPHHDRDQRNAGQAELPLIDTTKFIACLTCLSEASVADWHVWTPQGDNTIPAVGGLFVPFLVPNSSEKTDWALLALEANRRWARVYTSTSNPGPAFRERVKTIVSGLRLCDVAPKIIFPAPIYQEDTDRQCDSALVLIVSACYRAAGFDIPDVVEDLNAWRLVITDMLAPEFSRTANHQPSLKIEDKVSNLCRQADDIRKSIRLERSIAASLVNSDLPDIPIATCAQVFSKLATNLEAPKAVQERMEYIAHTVASAGGAAARGVFGHEEIKEAMDSLFKALGEENETD